MKPLTLKDFQSDYTHICVLHLHDKVKRSELAHEYIQKHYNHVKFACYAWLQTKEVSK